MKQFFFGCYPWDLKEEGYDLALSRLAGEIGVNAVSVAAAFHDVTEFRPRTESGPRIVRHKAGIHFQPSESCYQNTRLRPTAAGWMKGHNPLEKIARSCEKRSLILRAQVVGCNNSTLAKRYPMATCVNVFGDSATTWLCPANPDVREYLAALVEDLSTHYSIKTVELQAIHFGDGMQHHRHFEAGVHFDDTARQLLGWCFCPSCRQRAEEGNIDVHAVVRAVTSILQSCMDLRSCAARSFRELLQEDAHLAAYHRSRCEAIRSLIQSIRRRTDKRLILHAEADSFATGLEIASLREVCDGFLVPPTENGQPSGFEHAIHLAKITEAVDQIEAGTLCYPPTMADGPTLVSSVHDAATRGFAAIGFYHYGIVPEPCLDWVRQAIRYARRETISPTQLD